MTARDIFDRALLLTAAAFTGAVLVGALGGCADTRAPRSVAVPANGLADLVAACRSYRDASDRVLARKASILADARRRAEVAMDIGNLLCSGRSSLTPDRAAPVVVGITRRLNAMEEVGI